MAVLWLIGIAALAAWFLGVRFLPDYSPWVHAPALIVLLAVVALIFRPRPRVQRRA
jgi:hypothetical protein